VSLHKSILANIRGNIGAAIAGRLGGVQTSSAIVAPAIGAAGRVLPAIGRVLGSRTAGAAAAGVTIGGLLRGGGGDGCPSGFHFAKDGSGNCVRNRRMNFGNARAARRSVRRLKGARKLLRDIEKMMPTKTRTRRQPQHHHHPAAGG